MLDKFKAYADIFSRGLAKEMAPEVGASIISRLLRDWQVDRSAITAKVEQDASLWEQMTDEHRKRIVFAAHRIGDLNWITEDWFIDVLLKERSPQYRDEFRFIAGMFLNIPECSEWLKKQVRELKSIAFE